MHDAMERGLTLEARVVRVTWPEGRPVWEVELPGGIKGLVPSSETGLEDAAAMPRYVGQTVNVKVKGLDRENGLAACSRREAVAEASQQLLEALKENQTVDAVVRAVYPNRVAVDIGGGFTVEVPRIRATQSRVLRLTDLYNPGQAVKAKVLRVDPQTGAVDVSLINDPDPWEGVDYRRGDFISGIVTSVDEKHVFVEVKPGVVALAPRPLRGDVKRGDKVTMAVASFDRQARKLRCRLRGRLA